MRGGVWRRENTHGRLSCAFDCGAAAREAAAGGGCVCVCVCAGEGGGGAARRVGEGGQSLAVAAAPPC